MAKIKTPRRPSFEERFEGKLSNFSVVRSTPTRPVLCRVDDGLHASFEALAGRFGTAIRRQASSTGRYLPARSPSLQSLKSLSNSISETAKQQRRSRRNTDEAGGACRHQRMNCCLGSLFDSRRGERESILQLPANPQQSNVERTSSGRCQSLRERVAAVLSMFASSEHLPFSSITPITSVFEESDGAT